MIRPEILQKLNPAPHTLLIALGALVDDSMLEEIAAADAGIGIEENLIPLYRIRDHQEALAPLRWYPREALELTSWSEPDKTYPTNDVARRRGHIIRAFACTALLRSYAEPSNQGYADGYNQTLAQLLASLAVIGNSIQVVTLNFMAWLVRDLTETYEDGPFYVLTLLVLILRTQANLTAAEIQEIINFLFAFENEIRLKQPKYRGLSDHWLLGLTNHDQRHEVWKQIGKEIGTLAVNYKDVALETILLDIAKRLSD